MEGRLRQLQRRNEQEAVIAWSAFGILGCIVALAVTATIQAAARRRHIADPERPPLPGAGAKAHALIAAKSAFVAREPFGAHAQEIQIDGAKAVVVFRNFVFVSSFVRNSVRTRVELPFSDLLVGLVYHHRGRATLVLRTTEGKVGVGEDVEPFETLVELLLDLVELNRTSPERYRAALAREPRVHTPWYGWGIICLALAAAIAVGWLILSK